MNLEFIINYFAHFEIWNNIMIESLIIFSCISSGIIVEEISYDKMTKVEFIVMNIIFILIFSIVSIIIQHSMYAK